MNHPFLQIHTLTSYPGALLNRDDVGSAKRLPFGGASRLRISSQCLKRHWRRFKGEGALRNLAGTDLALRSRRTFEVYVLKPLIEEDGVAPEVAEAVTHALMQEVLGENAEKAKKKAEAEARKAKKAQEDGDDDGDSTTEPVGPQARTSQVTVLGPAEVAYLREQAKAYCGEAPDDAKKAAKLAKKAIKGDLKKNLQAVGLNAGLDAALFGRMITGDLLARHDAAIHVAHALTVHEEETELDYFSAVDDLLEETGETGSGHINTAELTSGLYYGYVVVDLPLLVANLTGCSRQDWENADRSLAAQVVERLIHMVATVSPGAKLGSTAPHSCSHLVLVEAGAAQPRTLANAFLAPVRADEDLLRHSYEALGTYLGDLDSMYGLPEARFSAIGPVDALEPGLAEGHRTSMDQLAAWGGEIARGKAAGGGR